MQNISFSYESQDLSISTTSKVSLLIKMAKNKAELSKLWLFACLYLALRGLEKPPTPTIGHNSLD